MHRGYLDEYVDRTKPCGRGRVNDRGRGRSRGRDKSRGRDRNRDGGRSRGRSRGRGTLYNKQQYLAETTDILLLNTVEHLLQYLKQFAVAELELSMKKSF